MCLLSTYDHMPGKGHAGQAPRGAALQCNSGEPGTFGPYLSLPDREVDISFRRTIRILFLIARARAIQACNQS